MPSDDTFDQAWDIAKEDVVVSDFEKGLIDDFRNARRQAQVKAAYRGELANTLMSQINPWDKFSLPEPEPMPQPEPIPEPMPQPMPELEPELEPEPVEEVVPESQNDTLASIEEKVKIEDVKPETKTDILAEVPRKKKATKRKAGENMEEVNAPEPKSEIEYADDRGDDRFAADRTEQNNDPENAETLIQMLYSDDPEEAGRSFATLCKLAASGQASHIEKLNQWNRNSEVKLLADKMNTSPKNLVDMRNKSVVDGKEAQLRQLQAKQDRITLEGDPEMDYTDTAAFKLPESVKKLNKGKAQTSMTDNPEQALEAWGEGKPVPVLDVRGNPVKLNGKTGWTIGRGKDEKGKAINVAFHPDHPEGIPLDSLKRPNKALGQTTSKKAGKPDKYTTVEQVKRQSEGTRDRAMPLPLYFPMPGSEAIEQKSGKVIKSEAWTPVANPFANPFHNPEAFRVNNRPPPISTEQVVENGAGADTTDGPVLVSNPATDILKKSGFDTREGDNLSMLPSMMPKENTDFSNTSLLPRGWDSE